MEEVNFHSAYQIFFIDYLSEIYEANKFCALLMNNSMES